MLGYYLNTMKKQKSLGKFIFTVPQHIKQVPWGWRAIIGIAAWSLIGASILSMVVLLITGVLDPTNDLAFKDETFGENLATLYWSMFTLAGTFLIVRRKPNLLKNLGLRKFSLKQAAIVIIVVTILMMGLYEMITYALEHLVAGYDAEKDLETINITNWSSWWLAFVVAVVFAPIVEEVLFRGVALPALANKFGMLPGVLIVSGVFAIGHWSLANTPGTFVASIILCYMYVRFKSIVPGILLHVTNNSIALLMIMPK